MALVVAGAVCGERRVKSTGYPYRLLNCVSVACVSLISKSSSTILSKSPLASAWILESRNRVSRFVSMRIKNSIVMIGYQNKRHRKHS